MTQSTFTAAIVPGPNEYGDVDMMVFTIDDHDGRGPGTVAFEMYNPREMEYMAIFLAEEFVRKA